MSQQLCWLDPGGSVLFNGYENLAGAEDSDNGDEGEQLNFGRVPWARGGVTTPWDVGLSWPGQIIRPDAEAVPEHIRRVWACKFGEGEGKKPRRLKNSEGVEVENERYLIRVLGPGENEGQGAKMLR